MVVTPNEYLDARRPEWLDAEVIGAVRYDPRRRVVVLERCPEIAAAIDARAMLSL